MHVDSEEAELITTRAEVVFFGVNTPPHLLQTHKWPEIKRP